MKMFRLRKVLVACGLGVALYSWSCRAATTNSLIGTWRDALDYSDSNIVGMDLTFDTNGFVSMRYVWRNKRTGLPQKVRYSVVDGGIDSTMISAPRFEISNSQPATLTLFFSGEEPPMRLKRVEEPTDGSKLPEINRIPFDVLTGHPQLSVSATNGPLGAVFEFQMKEINGLTSLQIWRLDTKEYLWDVDLANYRNPHLRYAEVPTHFTTFNGNVHDARQKIPAEGKLPPQLPKGVQLGMAVGIQWDGPIDAFASTRFFTFSIGTNGNMSPVLPADYLDPNYVNPYSPAGLPKPH